MKKLSIASLLLFAVLVFACSKSEDSKPEEPQIETPKKPSELILGSWNYVTDVNIEHGSGKVDTITTTYGVTDSLTFLSNGTIAYNVPSQNQSGTSTYRFVSDSAVILFGDTCKILTITDKKLYIYSKYLDNPSRPEWGEDFLEFKK